jgi:hypothetical protein
MNKREYESALMLINDLENEALAHGERQTGTGAALCYAREALQNAIKSAHDEYVLFGLAQSAQQKETEQQRATIARLREALETLVRRIERDNLHTTHGVKLEPARAALNRNGG